MSRVAVVGGGISGLAAARGLALLGWSVVLLEAAGSTGGKLRTSEIAGLAVDEGAEAFLVRTPEVVELASAVGLGDRLAHPATSTAAVWARGELRPIPAGTVMGVPSDPGRLAGVLSDDEVERVRADRDLPGTPPAAEPGGDVAVGHWLRTRVGPAVVDRLVDPLLGGVYAGRADELSLAATLPQLPRDEVSALAAATRALPPARPPGASVPPVFGTVTSGLGSLAAAVTADLGSRGVEVLTGATVRRIERRPDSWRVVHGPTIDEQALEVDAVVLALPPTPASRLLAGVSGEGSQLLAGVDTASVAIVTTAWRADDAARVTGSGYLVPAEAGRPVKAVTYSSAKWRHLAGQDLVVVRASIGRHREVAVLQRDDTELAALATAELTSTAGFTGAPVAVRVTRWGGALPQYAVGHLDRVAAIRRAVAQRPGLAVCGATYDGVGIPACLRSAALAVAQVTSPAAP